MESDCIAETATRTKKCYQFIGKTLQYLVLVSFFPFLYSHFSGFPIFFSYNIQFSTLIFPLFAHVLDRKYMFLICNGILAFLAKNLKFSSSSGLVRTAEDGVKQITELPPVLKVATVQENVGHLEYASSPTYVGAVAEEKGSALEKEQDSEDFHRGAEEMTTASIFSESDEEDDELKEETALLDGASPKEEVSDASVSTEELNQKFEEFTRKMKEEIRIETQQQLITV